MTKLSAVFLQKTLGSHVWMEKKIISGPNIHFWAVGEAFFSDLRHFAGFADFARFADFGCLKLIAKANHLLSGGRINLSYSAVERGPEWPLVWPVMAIFGPTVHPTEGHPV